MSKRQIRANQLDLLGDAASSRAPKAKVKGEMAKKAVGAKAAPKASPKAKAKAEPGGRRQSAESMATRQQEISVSEFFSKNRHLLGFDNPAKALLTTVKEAVDNALDACEEAGILPRVHVSLVQISEDRYRIIVEDNGPGIVKEQIPKIFGKLLYGSKFHRLKQSRGQQGIGISAAGMYGQLTTGKPVVVTSKTGPDKDAHQFAILLNTKNNKPEITDDRFIDWTVDHGTRVEIELEGSYKGGRRSIDEYLEQTAIANPHVELSYAPPKGRAPLHLPRATADLPPEPTEILPHPYGVELGMLIKLLKDSPNRTVSGALQADFSRVTARVADALCAAGGVKPTMSPKKLDSVQIEKIYRAIPKVKIMAPPTDCIVPIGAELIQKGLEREIKADFYVSTTRPPFVYRGNPFRIEVGLAYGGSLRQRSLEEEEEHKMKAVDRSEGPITLIRFANRVPLQYQQSACAIFRAVADTSWKSYGLSQPRGSLPIGPAVLLVHMASVWVPFTSESKEAIAHYPEILKEMNLGLRDCGRKLASYLRRREKARLEERRRSIFHLYIGELAQSLSNLTGYNKDRIQKSLTLRANEHAGAELIADQAGITAGDENDDDNMGDMEQAELESGEESTEETSPRAAKKAVAKKKAPAKKAKAVQAKAVAKKKAAKPQKATKAKVAPSKKKKTKR